MDKRPVHTQKDSLFSTSSGWTNYKGFFNLAILLLIVSNGRVALENLIKYGIMVKPIGWVLDVSSALSPFSPYAANILVVICSNVTILTVLLVEKILAMRFVGNWFAVLFYPPLFALHLTVPALYVLESSQGNPLYSFIALEIVVVEFLKLISYVHVNYWYRKARDENQLPSTPLKNGHVIKENGTASPKQTAKEHSPQHLQNGGSVLRRSLRRRKSTASVNNSTLNTSSSNNSSTEATQTTETMANGTATPHNSPKTKIVENSDESLEAAGHPPYSSLYPGNLTLGNIYYFMLAPTLCYELWFPRTPKRRWRFIFKRVVELIAFSFVILALCQQWILPLLKNSLAPFSEMDVKRCVERVLKLAIPNHIVWLMLFYWYFHSFLNLMAELLCFADREFYRDFWNSESIGTFWRTWNIPVHRWAARHVFKPITRHGGGKILAAFAVFSISAFFHEYLISVPLKMFRLWACAGMLAQIPLGFLTDYYFKGGRAGNVVVWLSLILGQPMAILTYLHDWYLLHYPEEHYAAVAAGNVGVPQAPSMLLK